MGAIRDDAEILFTPVPPEDLAAYDEDEAYAFLAGVGPETSTAKLPPVVTAAAAADGAQTGAMVALVPSDEDARRLAVDGGEPINQLHVTLAYLGNVAEISPEAQRQVVRAVRAAVEDAIRPDYDLPLRADGFALSVFNPGDASDRETCVVLGLSGADLDAVHGIVEQTLEQVQSERGDLAVPDQHAPWTPHVTLIYTDDVAQVGELTDRVGPITFDRLRVAFGDQVTDVPLNALNSQPSATVTVAAGGDRMPWTVKRRGVRWCVVKKTDGSTVACHDSEDEAQAQLRALYASEPSARELALAIEHSALEEFARESDVNIPVGGSHNLRDYWVHGEGAAKIRWGTEGDGTRCIKHLRKYVRDPGGLCQEYHRMATGKSMHPHPGRLTEADELEEFVVDEYDDDDFYEVDTPEEFAFWKPSEHPRGAGGLFIKVGDVVDFPHAGHTRRGVVESVPPPGFKEHNKTVVRDVTGKLHIVPKHKLTKVTEHPGEEEGPTRAENIHRLRELERQLEGDEGLNSRESAELDRLKKLYGASKSQRGADREHAQSFVDSQRRAIARGKSRESVRQRLSDLEGNELDRVAENVGVHVEGLSGPEIRDEIVQRLFRSTHEHALEFADDTTPTKPYGDVKYADPGYQADGRKRYPIDTLEHVRAAWSYINMPKNAAKYSADQLKSIRNKIKRAMSGIGAEVTAQVVVVTAAGRKRRPPVPDVRDENCGPGQHRMPDGSCMDDAEMRTYADEQQVADEPWEGVLTVEGAESGDGRMFAFGSLDWADLPLPLMYQPANVGGHTGAIIVGEITRAARRDNEIYGWGKVNGDALAGEHGDGIRTMMKTGGVSVDVDKVKDADVEMVYDDESDAGFATKPDATIYHRGRIRGATLVAYPAFVEAKLRFTNEVQTASADGDCGCDEPLVASGTHTITLPDLPPREWFEKPTDVKMYGALTITDEGRVYGRLAPAGVTHRNVNRRVPMTNVDYSRWLKAETIVADGGRVVTGAITGNCGHAATQNYGTLMNRKEHYDNSCSVFANVNIGEDADGVWVAGALRHGVTGEQVAQAMACSLSGDWQPHPDRPGINEFIAALLVPVPGFPLARTQPSVVYQDGVVVASSVPVRLGVEEPPSAEERARQALRTAKAALLTRAGLDPYSRKREVMARVREN